MPLNNFIKQNLALVLGIALPVVLMLAFMIAAAVPNMLAAPPHYDMLFSINARPDGSTAQIPLDVTLRVHDHKLIATYRPRKKNANGQYDYGTWRRLYLYDAKAQTVRPLDFPLPDDAFTMTKAESRPVASAKELTLNTTAESPDGYVFENGNYGGGGFMGDLFWNGSRYREPQLVKGSAHVPLKINQPHYYYYYDADFIGWVTAQDAAKKE